MMDGTVQIDDLMQYLQNNGLVITRRELLRDHTQLQFEKLLMDQKQLLKSGWLSYKQIIDNKLLNYSSRTGLIAALKKRSDFNLVVKEISGITMVLTSTIKQMRNEV
jgi:hypothetical protein